MDAPVEIRPIRLPANVEDPDVSGASELAAYVALVHRLDAETLGTSELARSPRELLADLTEAEYTRHVALGAFEEGRIVGLAELQWELDEQATTAFLPMLGVEPAHRRHGIGSRLLAAAEEAAAAAGRRTLVLSAEHLLAHDDGHGERLRAPQGEASIRGGSAVVRFAQRHGYTLGQLDRVSVLSAVGRADEFTARLAELEASARTIEASRDEASRDEASRDEASRDEASAPETSARYRVVTWIDRAPDDLVDSLARAHERMSIDAPSGEIAYEFEPWDAARVRDDERRSLERGRTSLFAAAIAEDGEVAGFTQLSLLPGSAAVEQWDTIVLAAHRGHRLGMRLKLANLALLARTDPTRERVYTWNADENRHMLQINEALGFEGFVLESQWQKPLTPPGS